MLDLDTCNASASDSSTVSFPKSGDSAGRGNGLVTMMNSTFIYHSGPGQCSASSHQRSSSGKYELLEQIGTGTAHHLACRGGQVHAVPLAALMLVVITEQQAGKESSKRLLKKTDNYKEDIYKN